MNNKPAKFLTVIFSPFYANGEIGENLPLAKFSRYTVYNYASCGIVLLYESWYIAAKYTTLDFGHWKFAADITLTLGLGYIYYRPRPQVVLFV